MPILMRDKKGKNMTPAEQEKANKHVRQGFFKIIMKIDEMLERDFHFMTDTELAYIEGIRTQLRAFDKMREG